ncbi:MAG: hypothetical protein U9R57_16415 [Thermodesulfobacteriota bacterium]|nr:hypothetical protein [Thermodesulfobacteriota bacterium]
MKIYGITIQPLSPFGTPLKGDTLFGHFCWQVAEAPDLLTGGLDKWIDCYDSDPFALFSSAWPVLRRDNSTLYAIARPSGLLPDDETKLERRAKIQRYKLAQKQKWLLIDRDLRINVDANNLQSDTDLFSMFLENLEPVAAKPLRLLAKEQQKLCIPVTQAHNSINRLTMTTGSGEFAPFSHDNFQFVPGLQLIIFVAVNEEAMDAESLQTGFERIGSWGYGRDASTGLGRFSVVSVEEQSWPQADNDTTACYTLGPSVPQKETFVQCNATPFTRFGRHGSTLASSANPFKKPVVMADEGAVLYPAQSAQREIFAKSYIGTAVRDVSAAHPRTVVQGYSLYLPC